MAPRQVGDNDVLSTGLAPARIKREQEFHDQRFTDDSARAAAGRFYELAGGASASYQATIEGVPRGLRALEYGAGTGGQGFALARRGVEVTGIDISSIAVEKANATAAEQGLSPSQCVYLVMNAEKLEFPDDSFDLVFGSGILHHLDLDAALAEVSRVLSPSGTAVFFEPLGHNPFINLYRRLTPQMRTEDEHPLKMDDLKLARKRFGSVSTESHVLTTFAAVPLRRLSIYQRAIDALNRFDSALFDRFPATSRWAWITVVRFGDPV